MTGFVPCGGGNLVCPCYLGEQAMVAVLSLTAGEDQPLKHSHMFRASSIMIINKIVSRRTLTSMFTARSKTPWPSTQTSPPIVSPRDRERDLCLSRPRAWS